MEETRLKSYRQCLLFCQFGLGYHLSLRNNHFLTYNMSRLYHTIPRTEILNPHIIKMGIIFRINVYMSLFLPLGEHLYLSEYSKGENSVIQKKKSWFLWHLEISFFSYDFITSLLLKVIFQCDSETKFLPFNVNLNTYKVLELNY